MADNRLLRDMNQCPLTGYESKGKVKPQFAIAGVSMYTDQFGRERWLYAVDGEWVCCILLTKQKVIEFMFTHEDHRRKGYARQLLAVAQIHNTKRICDDGHLSQDGEKFFKK